MNCGLSDKCSGCDRIHLDLTALARDRQSELARLRLDTLPSETIWIRSGGLRDRLEFTLTPDHGASFRLGLFAKPVDLINKPEIVDIAECPQLSQSLQSWLTEFRRDLPVVAASRSVRLRVAPNGTRGAWLDFSNEDIRDLLEQGTWIERQLANGIILELGQKRKRVVRNPEGPRAHRLIDPVLDPWFETLVFRNEKLETAALYSTIGTFTQPGFEANQTLVKTVLDHIGSSEEMKTARVAEFGAGIGNFTLPLLSTGAAVDVFESDRLALSALEKGVKAAELDSSKLSIHTGDFIQSAKAADKAFGKAFGPDAPNAKLYDTVVVDPPRPGLGRFLDAIHMHAAHAKWVYVSCYPESFAKDANELASRGLKLSRLTIVEQFPFTRHFEIVASFTTQGSPKSKH